MSRTRSRTGPLLLALVAVALIAAVTALAPGATAQSPAAKPTPSPTSPPPPPPGSGYAVVEIGTLPGYDASTGVGINEAGQVVGTLQQTPYGAATAFVWSQADGIQALGTFEGRGTTGSAINDQGEVAGSAIGFVYNPGFGFTWTPEDGFVRLDPPAGVYGSSATGINDAGEAAGAAQVSGPWPVRWDEDGGQAVLIGSLGGNQGIAFDINNAGQIVGYSRNAQSYPRPFVWDPQTGTMRDLGTFRRTSTSTGIAHAINELGHVAGDADSGPSGFGRAFLWTGGSLIAIGPELSYAYALNDLDHVVGQFTTGGRFRAFLYRGGVFRNLNTLIPPGTGIVLESAWGINNEGLIVANGTNAQGRQRAFVLIPQ